ncbi:hypothetical protein CAEBREN_00329 [Caenorhabditis brenneri]|uniref:Uncharacterized protein n=1 Tax=Caenorhabditis brenneri TaxID=135651 RepID=G0PFM0_CAEBE|nr:hypothetical protein CAEBREN_00329 [Caenorhabditis brenneri]
MKNIKRYLTVSPSEKPTDKRSKSSETSSRSSSVTLTETEMNTSASDSTTTTIPIDVGKSLSDSVAKLACLKKVTKDELAALVVSMANVVVTLQKQNSELVNEVRLLSNEVKNMRNSFETANKKTFAEIVQKTIASPSAQVTFMNAAKLANESDDRKSSVIIRGAQVSTDMAKDDAFGKSISEECNVTGKCSVFRISPKDSSPPLLKIHFEDRRDAIKTLTTFNSIKSRVTGCHNATIRQDMSKPELSKFRDSWKQAIKNNNEAGQRIWTVRNLELVRIPYKDNQTPHPWTVRNRTK